LLATSGWTKPPVAPALSWGALQRAPWRAAAGATCCAWDRNQGRSRSALGLLASELRAEWQSAAVELKLQFVNDGATPLSTAEPSDAKARRVRGPGKGGARRVA